MTPAYQRPLVIHQCLLAAAVWASLHMQWPYPVETLLAITGANGLLWLLVTRWRLPVRPRPWSRRDVPWLLAVPTAYLLVYSVYTALRYDRTLVPWLAETPVYVLTIVLAAVVFRASRDPRPFLAALCVVSVAIVAEGTWILFHRGHWMLILRLEALRRNAQVEFTTFRMGSIDLPYYNVFASVLTVFASAALGLAACSATVRGRALAYGACAVSVLGVLLTGSRAGTVFLLLLTLAHVAFRRRSWKPAVIAGLVTLAGVAAFIAHRPGGMLRGSASLRTRFHIWRVCLRIAREHPLLGGGPNAFADAWKGYGPWHGYGYAFTTVDGLYLDLLSEGGFPLLAAFAWLAAGLLWEAMRLIRTCAEPVCRHALFALTAGLAAMLAHDMIEASLKLRASYLLVCVLCGLILALRGAGKTDAGVEWQGSTYRMAGSPGK